jgi:hypothetical protein
MPKLIVTYPVNLNAKVTSDMMTSLQAIAHHRGDRGRYAGVVRDLLQRGIHAYVSGLSERERADYKQIFDNLRAPDALRKY